MRRGLRRFLRARVSGAHQQERGSVSVFTLGALIVVLLLIIVLTVAAGTHLERKKLWNLTDSITLEISDTATYQAHIGSELGTATVRNEVAEVLANRVNSGIQFEGLRVGPRTEFTAPDAVTVHLVATTRPGTLPWVLAPWSDGITIEAESSSYITLPD